MEDFRSKILTEARNLMLNEQQHETSMKSWNGPETKGFEVVFEGVKRAVPIVSGIVGQIFITQDGDFEAIVNGYVVKNSLRSVVSTFTVTPSANLCSEVCAGLSSFLLAVTSSLTISHILTIPSICDKILKLLSGNEAARLAQANKATRSSLTCVEVDRTFWKEKLRCDFDAQKVQQAIAKSRRFFKVYGEAQMERKAAENAQQRPQRNLLLEDPLRIPPRIPQPGFFDPEPRYGHHPDTEFYNPLRDVLPPGLRPRNPPDFMGQGSGMNHPDLSPFPNPDFFRPPRPGGPGNPFQRGGPGEFGGGFI